MYRHSPTSHLSLFSNLLAPLFSSQHHNNSMVHYPHPTNKHMPFFTVMPASTLQRSAFLLALALTLTLSSSLLTAQEPPKNADRNTPDVSDTQDLQEPKTVIWLLSPNDLKSDHDKKGNN